MINGIKNVVAFGLIHGVVPWVTNMGYAKVSKKSMILVVRFRRLTTDRPLGPWVVFLVA